VTRAGGSWLALIHDPTRGFVSLRTTVTDAHGNRTTETINRGYGIS
jgi:hypothetical protein